MVDLMDLRLGVLMVAKMVVWLVAYLVDVLAVDLAEHLVEM